MILLLALLLSACRAAPPASSPGSTSGGGTTVAEAVGLELDIFSGRPNPVWQLSAADAALFEQKLAALPVTTPGQLANPLGYRGFIVKLGESTVTVQNGAVLLDRAGQVAGHKDPGRALERWLLDTGKPFLDEDLFKLVERQIPA
jgi:hypothetical protein